LPGIVRPILPPLACPAGFFALRLVSACLVGTLAEVRGRSLIPLSLDATLR
jgi:hypothetical protein